MNAIFPSFEDGDLDRDVRIGLSPFQGSAQTQKSSLLLETTKIVT